MKITKPIVFFDLETTSVDTETARIVEIACIKVFPNGTKETKTTLINPEIPIPQECIDIHGITDEMVKDKPTFKQIATSLREWFKDCDLGGYNSNSYDIPLLSAELVRAGLESIDWNPNLLDAFSLYRHLFPNTLSDVFERLTGKELENSHSALFDIEATIEIADILTKDLEQQTTEEIDLMLQADKLRFDLAGKLYKDEEGVVRWNFSKNKDKPVLEDKGFCNWFLGQGFPKESKDKLKDILNNA